SRRLAGRCGPRSTNFWPRPGPVRRPALTDDNQAAFIFGLGDGGHGLFEDAPSVSSDSEGECALGACVTDSWGRWPIWSGIVPVPSVEMGKGVNKYPPVEWSSFWGPLQKLQASSLGRNPGSVFAPLNRTPRLPAIARARHHPRNH